MDAAFLDYNGHMTEAAYLTAFGEAADHVFRLIGDDDGYRASGRSFYTVETHMNFFLELKVGEAFAVETLVVGFDDKRLHLFHRMFRRGELVATAEQMLLHVELRGRQGKPDGARDAAALTAIAAAHRGLAKPAELGRTMRVPKRPAKLKRAAQ